MQRLHFATIIYSLSVLALQILNNSVFSYYLHYNYKFEAYIFKYFYKQFATNIMATNISTINIKASAKKVWDALTKPELVKQWQYGSDLITDWKVGSDIKFKTEWQGTIYEQWGKIIEFLPYQKIIYNLYAPRPDLEDKSENYFIMSYILYEEDANTRLEIIQEDNRPGAVQENLQGEENPVLSSLKSLAER